jgi:hypothetical protein
MLEDLEGQSITCRAIAGRYSMTVRWQELQPAEGKRPLFEITLLLKNVTCLMFALDPVSKTATCARELIADHLWVRIFDGSLHFLRVIPGDQIEFEAELYSYIRPDGRKGWSFHKCTRLGVITSNPSELLSDPRRRSLTKEQSIHLAEIVGEEHVFWAPYANQWTSQKILQLWKACIRRAWFPETKHRSKVRRKTR